ncbi:MAG TPA: aspartate aminotransferase family protein [Lachnospiraceae bacterium]|mgnify:CR=1 FL=1|nr:aspartate aminotransferase family protein [Lachnospiraceae bacterium]
MLREELPKIITDKVPGPKAAEILKRRDAAVPKALCGTTYPVVIERGSGAVLEDADGNHFLDFIGGVGVLNIGYSNEEVIEAVKAQSEKYFHTIFNIVTHPGYVELAEKLNRLMPVRGAHPKTYFANSGAECDENAIKVARAFTKRPNIICFSGAFHGRTSLTMALTAKKSYSRGMGPFPAGIYRAEYPNLYRAPKGYSEEEAIAYYIDAFKNILIEATPVSDVAAVLMEPIEGEGGFVPAPIGYVKEIRKICDENGILLIADEVQCGNCRTGRFYASEYWKDAGCAPDIITTAKSLGAGLPISAITADEKIMDAVTPGTVGGTFCGNPLSCAAACKTLEIYERDDYAGKAALIGKKIMQFYKELLATYDVVGDVRGLGAMAGIEFVKDRRTKEPYPEFVRSMIAKAVQKGLLIENAGTYDNVIRFLAPLCITDNQLKAGFGIFEDCIRETLKELR